jgi:hypothetical protein
MRRPQARMLVGETSLIDRQIAPRQGSQRETPDREPHSTPHAPAVSMLAGRIIARAEDIGGFECTPSMRMPVDVK